MKKVAVIAAREFIASVATRGFVIGLLIVPALVMVAAAFLPRLMTPRRFQVRGQVAIVDPTGRVEPELRSTLEPAKIADRRSELTRQVLAAVPNEVRDFAGAANASPNGERALEFALGGIPDFELVQLPASTDVQGEKQWLTAESDGPRRLALVSIQPAAVVAPAGHTEYGAYELYVAANLDGRAENQIHQSVREAIVNARAREQSLDPEGIDRMVRVARVQAVTLMKDGRERQNAGVFNRAMPFAFVGLLMFAVIMGGQTLLTSTIEEKSSRVIEVLLSAVSPLELMTGKILGHMAVSLAALALYIVMALVVLFSFALLGLLDIGLVFYLILFFIISYLVFGSLMMALGAAVNDMREAQSLMTPIMILIVLPWLLAAPIINDPNSALSVTISFIPPVNTFAMLLRLSSSAPPPSWQVWLSIGIGVASVFGAIWIAAKVFRIGLLLYGKPPNVATLIRWVRTA
jgi:ABC-2 type transport system permease protein